MKKTFSWYFPPTKKQINEIWEKGIFTVDANVLLDLYRYNTATRNKILEVLDEFKSRAWLTYQTAMEFLDNRTNVISETQNVFDAFLSEGELVSIDKEIKKLEAKLNGARIFPKKLIADNISSFKQCLEKTRQAIEKERPPIVFHDDPILERIASIFQGKIGPNYSDDERKEQTKKAEERFEKSIPPGFKDKKKDTEEIFGDYFFWNQVLEKSKKEQKDVILVTSERKEDWWEIRRGETCANGASYEIAPTILRELGAEVIADSVSPDGININYNCGATHPERICRLVREYRADVGITLDGDADRVIFSDCHGNEVNGDRIIGLCALDMKARKRLPNNTIAVTIMSNLGLVDAMKKNGITTEITPVGDRYVIERMQEKGIYLGGEQSGHLIFLDYATTGDGIVSALHVLKLMKQQNKQLHELTGFMEEYPQKLSGLNVKQKPPLAEIPGYTDLIAKADKEFAGTGRTVIRYSGTENKVRILVEAKDEALAQKWHDTISDFLKKALC